MIPTVTTQAIADLSVWPHNRGSVTSQVAIYFEPEFIAEGRKAARHAKFSDDIVIATKDSVIYYQYDFSTNRLVFSGEVEKAEFSEADRINYHRSSK